MNQLVEVSDNAIDVSDKKSEDYVTFMVEDQLFGIPVLRVQDILLPDKIASIPLAPPEVAGSINLRGRIVTVIDVRTRLGIKRREDGNGMGVTVEHNNDLYTFLVDTVGEVLSMTAKDYEKNPGTLDSTWREYSLGVYRLDGRLMIVLDVEKLLGVESV